MTKRSRRIPEGWEEYKLSDVMYITGGGTPRTANPEYWNGVIPWISVTDFNKGRRWIYETEKKITEKGLKESSTKMLKKGSILISSRGTVGEIAQLKEDMAFNQTCYGLNGKKDIINDYLYYLLRYKTDELKSKTHGAVFDTITKETFKQININIPKSISEQKAIAKILSDLDEKIELNNQMNKTLEAMVRAIFKEWFIDFHFPGYEKVKMVDSELGKIPEGWIVDKLDNCIEFFKGKKPVDVTEEKREGYLPQILIETLNGGRFLYASKTNTIICEENDIIMVMDGASTQFISDSVLKVRV